MLYCVPGFGLGTNFHWLPSQCSIRVRCTLSAPAYCPTDHASVAESAVTAVSPPSAPTLGRGTLVQPFHNCPRGTLGAGAGRGRALRVGLCAPPATNKARPPGARTT